MISAIFLIAGIHSTTNYKLINKQKFSSTQQINNFHLMIPLRKNVIHSLVCVSFSVGSICKYWIYVIDDIWWHRLKYLKKVINCFRKTLHLGCLIRFWISLWMTQRDLTGRAILWKHKLKQIRTLFLWHSLTLVFQAKLKRFHGGFFELEMLGIFIRAFLLKISIRTWSCL